ncbi:MAG: nucleoid occlusion factor SlmA [Gammaproteobacteria bacterium]
MVARKPGRKQAILEVLARELEARPGTRITTAALAAALGVSEAALYRHFASKAKMFEGLIEFAEDAVFSRVTRILEEEPHPAQRCAAILKLLLAFAGRNPGIARILVGDALAGEHDRLRVRVGQFFDRIETQLRQVLREANLSAAARPRIAINAAAALMLAVAEGRMSRFVRSGFRDDPIADWDAQWSAIAQACFGAAALAPAH